MSIDTAIQVAIDMAQELQDIADSVFETTHDSSDVAHLRDLVARWESAYRAITAEEEM